MQGDRISFAVVLSSEDNLLFLSLMSERSEKIGMSWSLYNEHTHAYFDSCSVLIIFNKYINYTLLVSNAWMDAGLN